MNNKIYMIAYGMNTDPAMMDDRVGNATPIGVGTIVDHAYRFAYHADVYECIGSSVQVALWQIDETALAKLDDREGYPYYYERKLVPVRCGTESHLAWMYYMINKSREELPCESYLSTVRRGYTAFGMNHDQIDRALVSAADKYDSCVNYATPDEVRVLAALGDDAAILLPPAVIEMSPEPVDI